ncbi:MAG: Ig-like domain-containing protein, partial [Oceanobacter sp.]
SDAALTLTGQEDGAIIQYSVVDDQWGTEFEAVEGLNTVKVRQVDAAGNESDVTEFTFTLDTSKPTAPNGSLEDDLGASQTDGITSNGTILFGDASEDNLVYKYSLDGGDNWTVTTRNYVNLDEGTYAKGNIKVIAIDEAGNESDAYEHPIEVVVDRAAPELTSIQLGDTALKSGETTTVTFTFSEAVTDFDLNAISSGNGTLSGLNSDDGITWTATLTPLENTEANTNQISVGTSYKDIAGNAPTDSAQSDNFSVDTQLPSVNRIFIYGGRLGTGDTASVEFEFSEYMDESSITLEDFSATHGTLSNLNVTRGEGATIATMTYTPNANIQDVSGVISIGTDVQDLAGNSLVAQKDSDSIDIDTLAPNAPGIELLTDTGSSTGDLITSDGTLSLSGVEVGATVEYRTYDQGTESWSEWTDWSTAFTAVEGENSIQVRQTDSSDNVSDASDTFTFTLDTQAPEPEVEASKNTDTVKVEWQEPGYTLNNDLQPQITAIGSDGAYVVVWEDYDELGTGKTYIDLQIFNADGSKTDTSWFLSGEKPYNFSPKVTAIGAEGAFALTWFGWDSYGDLSVHVQFVDAEGTLADQVKLEAIGVTNGNDTHPQITEVGTDGSFVVTWVGDSTITTLEDIYAVYSQAFDASGSKSGEITQLAGITVDGISDSNDAYESVPAITAIGTEGAYAIAVVDSNNQIKVQAYELNGTPIGSTTTISVALAEDAHSPQIIALGDEGAYAVIWSKSWMVPTGTPLGSVPSSDVVIQRFNPDGSLNGGQEYVSQWMTTLTPNARIAAIGDEGAYVIVSSGQNHIEVKTFNADGSQSVADFSQDIASGNTGNAYPQVAEIGSDGAFVVIWSGSEESATDTISVQTFYPDGTPNGSTVTISAPGVDNDESVAPQVTAVGTEGDFVVTWSGDDTDGDQSVYVKLFVPDSITNDPVYDVVLADDAASWEYSLQGADFVAGESSNQISLTDGTYEADDIVIRQYDLAGNMTETSNGGALVVDTTAEAPVISLQNDSGLYDNDLITNDGTLSLSGVEEGATVQYSIDNENTWSDSFTAIEGENSVQVRQIDAAGNISAASETLTFELDTTPISTIDTSVVVFDLVNGTSSSHSDRTFQEGVRYTIYIIVDGDSESVNLPTDQKWSGAGSLASDTQIHVVTSDGSQILSSERTSADTATLTFSDEFQETVFQLEDANGNPALVLMPNGTVVRSVGDWFSNTSYSDDAFLWLQNDPWVDLEGLDSSTLDNVLMLPAPDTDEDSNVTESRMVFELKWDTGSSNS